MVTSSDPSRIGIVPLVSEGLPGCSPSYGTMNVSPDGRLITRSPGLWRGRKPSSTSGSRNRRSKEQWFPVENATSSDSAPRRIFSRMRQRRATSR